jgi:hypothetical protein
MRLRPGDRAGVCVLGRHKNFAYGFRCKICPCQSPRDCELAGRKSASQFFPGKQAFFALAHGLLKLGA